MMRRISIEKSAFCGWENCVELVYDDLRLVVPLSIGPRILFFGKTGGENLLKVLERDQGKTGGYDYRLYGGHRLWNAPEDPRFSYLPENEPIHFLPDVDGACEFYKEAQALAGLEKRICIEGICQGGHPGFRLTHTLINRNITAQQVSPWAITAFISGGQALMPLASRPAQPLCSQYSLAFWSYSRFDDPSLSYCGEFLRVDSTRRVVPKQKLGTFAVQPWLAYLLGRQLVFIYSDVRTSKSEIDEGANIQLYYDPSLLELEFLGEERLLETGEGVDLVENWFCVDLPDGLNANNVVQSPSIAQALLTPLIETAFKDKARCQNQS